ncbi:MAG: glutamate 5-kinase [Alphaproteobacteria bacterium TMED87]|nr:glutamate 5-kinase [Rhodospirillaceae bacterium]OUV09752.1 MAG: glutamate 5-kinase [Alphaproteobacteria bacterium TMED87]
METLNNPNVRDFNQIVIKIGSSLLVGESNQLQTEWLDSVCDDISEMHKRGQSVIIVTSGAISAGIESLGLYKKDLRLEEKQAAAAAGQMKLTQSYQSSLDRHKLNVAQVLLTRGDTEDRRRYLNSRETLKTLLRLNAIPLINENDTVATEEIRFGDNDQLAAYVAVMMNADLCILLSDVDGLYTKDPSSFKDAEHIAKVYDIDEEHFLMAGTTRSKHGTGGMQTKLLAAEICMNSGCNVVITNGKIKNPITLLDQKKISTWFLTNAESQKERKKWILSNYIYGNRVIIGKSTADALQNGRSLLPRDILDVEGSFRRGDTVEIVSNKETVLGKGLSAFGSEDIKLIMGHESGKIEQILGFKGRSEIIHIDDLVIDRKS